MWQDKFHKTKSGTTIRYMRNRRRKTNISQTQVGCFVGVHAKWLVKMACLPFENYAGTSSSPKQNLRIP